MKRTFFLLMGLGFLYFTPLMAQQKNDSTAVTHRALGQPLVLVNNIETDLQSLVLSPEHIEAINILKDKTATGQYGEKAREGVILITTKPSIEFYKITDFIDPSKSLNSSVTKIQLNGKLLTDVNKLLIEKTALVNTMISTDWKLDANYNPSSSDILVINTEFPAKK